MASSSGAKQTLVVRNGDAAANYVPYPPALVSYEDVVINPTLFLETLEKLHSSLGTKFMIPIIGGKDLDLHRLFVEVTSRGGFEKILRERRWKEVTNVFNFPSTATNASFVLRKYYMSLLHHFEQIYLFKAQGWIPSTDSCRSVPYCPVVPQVSTEEQQQRAEFLTGATSATATGSQVMGVIDGKFEGGYLVSVTIGSEKLKGVLYMSSQDPSPIAPHHLRTPQIRHVSPTIKKDGMSATSSTLRRRRRKKCEMKKRDPAHPKPNRSGYNFFFAEQHARLKPLYSGKDREISRMIGELWTNMKEPDKVAYQDKAAKDKERYITEMENYKEMLRTGKIISDAVPIQQLPLQLDPNLAGPGEGTESAGEGSLSSKSSLMSDSENKIADLDSECTSLGVEIGTENVPKEKEFFDELEGSGPENGIEDVKNIEHENGIEDVKNSEHKNENRYESLEVKVADCELKDIRIPEDEIGGSEERREVEDVNVENMNRSITLDEKESSDTRRTEKDGGDVGEGKKRAIVVEEKDLTTSDKRHKTEHEI